MEVDGDLVAELKTIEQDLCQVDRAIQKLQTKKRNLESRREELKHKFQQRKSEKLANLNWERTDLPWSEKATEVLTQIFKMTQFRPYQLATINAVMSKQDCILLMPTGGGKSLCYQLPALLLDGIALVVSPLVSLMEDQIMALEALNVPAIALSASCSRAEVNSTHKDMVEKGSKLKLLYVTPEKLAKSKRFMSKLEKMYQIGRFSLLAIDEVHCCSQWGHDFRPDYKFLGIMKRQFPNVPILGLTATATAKVITDLQKILNIQDSLVLKASFNRPNLRYQVCSKPSSQKESVDELETLLKGKFNGLSGIIYCFSIKESEDIAAELRARGLRIQSYHAQLAPKVRSSVHKNWVANKVQAVVATIAFGMGIDKPDVRFVIHHSMAKSMENFYQESGRAGRDDRLAHCILFYRFADMFRQSTMVFTEQTGLENLYAMVAYCLDLSSCRRAIIAKHFGENWNASDCKSMCDHCDGLSANKEEEKDVTKQYLSVCNILEHCTLLDERLTAQKLIDAWLGKGPPKLRPAGHVNTLFNRQKCERVVALLLLEGFLKEEFHFTPYSTISYINKGPKANAVTTGKLTVLLPLLHMGPKVLPSERASNSSVNDSPAKRKQKTGAVKRKACFVNDEISHFRNNQFGSDKSNCFKKLEGKKLVKRFHPVEQLSQKADIQISDDDGCDLDFGKVEFFKPKVPGRKKLATITISDSD